MVTSLNIHKGGIMLAKDCGLFLCPILTYRFSTPVWWLNGPTAFVVLSNGKGWAVFYSPPAT